MIKFDLTRATEIDKSNYTSTAKFILESANNHKGANFINQAQSYSIRFDKSLESLSADLGKYNAIINISDTTLDSGLGLIYSLANYLGTIDKDMIFVGNGIDQDDLADIYSTIDYWIESRLNILIIIHSKSGESAETISIASNIINKIKSNYNNYHVLVCSDNLPNYTKISSLGLDEYESSYLRTTTYINEEFSIIDRNSLLLMNLVGIDHDRFWTTVVRQIHHYLNKDNISDNPALDNAIMNFYSKEMDSEVFMPFNSVLTDLVDWTIYLQSESLDKLFKEHDHQVRNYIQFLGSSNSDNQAYNYEHVHNDTRINLLKLEYTLRGQRDLLNNSTLQNEDNTVLDAFYDSLPDISKIAKFTIDSYDEESLGEYVAFFLMSVYFESLLVHANRTDLSDEEIRRLFPQLS